MVGTHIVGAIDDEEIEEKENGWEQKNERKAEAGELFVTKAYVDEGVTLKRLRPAPQGRGYRIRKRSNHISLFVDTKAAATSTNDNQE